MSTSLKKDQAAQHGLCKKTSSVHKHEQLVTLYKMLDVESSQAAPGQERDVQAGHVVRDHPQHCEHLWYGDHVQQHHYRELEAETGPGRAVSPAPAQHHGPLPIHLDPDKRYDDQSG